ncbi:hypothetical protein TURU_036708 [Turdus rufiventris]|nr:hypothetical protein TURU_036708 [Turdus rufiventris]
MHIPEYSQIVSPLYLVTFKKYDLHWNTEQQQAFAQIKQKIPHVVALDPVRTGSEVMQYTTTDAYTFGMVILKSMSRSNKRYWDLEVNIMSKASAKTLGWCEERVLEQLGTPLSNQLELKREQLIPASGIPTYIHQAHPFDYNFDRNPEVRLIIRCTLYMDKVRKFANPEVQSAGAEL